MKDKLKIVIALLIIVIIAVILIFVLKPFESKNNSINNDINSSSGNNRFKEIQYESYSVDTYELVNDSNTMIISSDDLQKYCSSITEEGLLDTLRKYDDEYFSTKSLIILRVQENSGGILDEVIGVNKDMQANKINVFIKRVAPEMGNAVMTTKNIMIELNSEEAINVSEVEIVPEGIDYE